jgi:Kdo2-lipid IVA lauroyltransferase/acyltransferase
MAIRSNTILNTIIISSLKGLSRLPFSVLYIVSDILAVVLRYVAGYRKKVIWDNLKKSFPRKSDAEIRIIMKAYYRHMCDIMIETVKAWSMSGDDFEERLTLKGIDELNALCDEGKSVIMLSMHFNNWEWCAYTQVHLKHKYLVVYNPVRGNPMFEKYLTTMRERWGARTIAVHQSARTIIDFHQRNIPVCLALVADQRPPVVSRLWTSFLNQEACFNSGPGKIASKTDQPVYIAVGRKLKRGYYELSFIPLIMNPGKLSQEEILITYVRAMEKYILESPENYLWSHKRWSQTRPDGYELYP